MKARSWTTVAFLQWAGGSVQSELINQSSLPVKFSIGKICRRFQKNESKEGGNGILTSLCWDTRRHFLIEGSKFRRKEEKKKIQLFFWSCFKIESNRP